MTPSRIGRPLTESDIWLRGAHLDSRSVKIDLEIHGDVLKFSDYSEIVQYINKGDIRGLVREKVGQNQNDYLDILARNAFASHPHKIYADRRHQPRHPGGRRPVRALPCWTPCASTWKRTTYPA